MATKDQLLSYLKANKGDWISGEMISSELSVSRAAISKHIRSLREDGYQIESAPRKGYLLRQTSSLLLTHEIRDGLDTKLFGQKDIVYFRETDSTNRQARELAAGGAAEGTVVIAETQTHGRGRKGRQWFSPAGTGIYASLIIRPKISPGQAPRITLMTAVAIAEALLALLPLNVRIKWPNDILVNGRKLAGILTEISTDMDVVDYIIVGLGLNVNTTFESSPAEVKTVATSILTETGNAFPRINLIRACLRCFEECYARFKNDDFEPIMQRWKELSDIIGQKIRVGMIDRTLIGDVVDVDDDGVLILKDGNERIHRIFSGDVSLLK